ncbi:MAG: hypothetical protein IH851_06035 [Armatimonadetes bacterium]|nr:hypothetical protein [Armatimonadota bacterium]
MDVLVAFSVLVLLSLLTAALMPTLSRSQKMSDEMSKAVQIASREIELLRAAGYDNLNYDDLLALDLIDTWSGEGPFTFSNIPGDEATGFSMATMLQSGTSELEIFDVSDTLREVVVRVKWTSASGKARTTELTTLVGK